MGEKEKDDNRMYDAASLHCTTLEVMAPCGATKDKYNKHKHRLQTTADGDDD